MKFRRFIGMGKGLQACQIAAGSVIKQASYEALKYVALRLVAILDAYNSLAIYLPDIKFRRFIGMGKGYKHAKLQLDRLSNKPVMRL